MTGAAFAMAPCISCGRIFAFNPEQVPSIRARREIHHLNRDPRDNDLANLEVRVVEDADAPRQPVCRDCVEAANPIRVRNGLEPIQILPNAYGAVGADGSGWEW